MCGVFFFFFLPVEGVEERERVICLCAAVRGSHVEGEVGPERDTCEEDVAGDGRNCGWRVLLVLSLYSPVTLSNNVRFPMRSRRLCFLLFREIW